MGTEPLERKLAVILHADVVSSTELVRRNETIAHGRILNTFARLSDTVHVYGGVVHELRGDALLAEFRRASDAVSAALAFQVANVEHNAALDDDIRPEVRVGVSLGEVVISDGTLTGPDVVLAQRLEQLAAPGGICISQAAYQSIPERLPFDYEDLGEQRIKGFDKAVRVYSIVLRTGETIPEPEPAATVSETGPARHKYSWAVASMVVLLSVAAGVLWFKPWAPQWESHDKPSIVVLPFTSMGDESGEESFADGMTDDLITDLSRISGLFVIARHTSFSYKGEPVNIPEMAEELGVRYVLEGSVRRVGGKVRINAQLIDAATGGHLWAERYDSDGKDVFSLQNQVIGRIATALEVTLTDTEKSQLARIPTSNLEAYDYYQRAEQLNRGFRVPDKGDAMELYQQAVALDPDFANAHAGHGLAAWKIWRFGADNVMPGPVARKLAYESASKALEVDPENSRAFSVLAMLQVSDGQHEQALESAQHAIDLAPSNAWAYVFLALVLVAAGEPAEAHAAMQTASRLDPKPPPWFYSLQGWVLFFDHRFQEAIESLENGAQGGAGYFAWLAMAHAQLGRDKEARALIEQVYETVPFASVARARARYAHYRRKEDIELIVESLRRAGLPEWPFGYQGNERDRLDSGAVESVTIGRTWVGYRRSGGQFVQQFTENGQVAHRSAGMLLTGTAWDDDGMLCIRYEAINMGRASCGFLFRNPRGTAQEQNEYIYLNDSDVLHFSVKQ